jgi:addiction module RelE/StbE family toxin
MAFRSITTGYFDKKFSKFTDKNRNFKSQIINKMKGIRQNPEIGEPKSHNLRGLRALHVSEHFVIVYLIFKNYIIFINVDHHNNVYNPETSKRLMKRLLEDEGLLAALIMSDISEDDFTLFVMTLGKHQ